MIQSAMLRSARPMIFLVGSVVSLTFGACQQGPGSEPPRAVPAWSPPTWLHGTWTASGDGWSATLKASRYNVVFDTRASGVTYSIDVAQVAEDGFATVHHDAGVLGLRFYFVRIDEAGGSSTGYTFWRLSATEIEGFVSVWDSRGVRTDTGPYPLTKQESGSN